LHSRGHGILGPASGGCSRYLFTAEVSVTVDGGGHVSVAHASSNPSQRDMLSRSGLSLRLLVDCDADGVESRHLVLTGSLEPAGDAVQAGSMRAGRFLVHSAHVEFASGRRVRVVIPGLNVVDPPTAAC
jgi:hypothetical protein